MRKAGEKNGVHSETRQELDKLWKDIANLDVPDEDLLARVAKSIQMTGANCSEGFNVLDMVCITPGRAGLLRDTGYRFNCNDDELLRKVFFAYQPEQVQYLMGSVHDLDSITSTAMVGCFSKLLADGTRQAFNMIGPDRLRIVLGFLDQREIIGGKQVDLYSLIELDSLTTPSPKHIIERWNEILLGCSVPVLRALNDVLPVETNTWINSQSADKLFSFTRRKTDPGQSADFTTDADDMPKWLTSTTYSKGFWRYYINQIYPLSFYKDSKHERLIKIAFMQEVCSEKQKENIVGKLRSPLWEALENDDFTIARSLLTHFGRSLITKKLLENVLSRALSEQSYDHLACLFMESDSFEITDEICREFDKTPKKTDDSDDDAKKTDDDQDAAKAVRVVLIDILTYRIVRKKIEPHAEVEHKYRKKHENRYITLVTDYMSAVERARKDALSEEYLFDQPRFVNSLKTMFSDLVSNRLHWHFADVVDCLAINEFSDTLALFGRDTPAHRVFDHLLDLSNRSWCTIYHYNATVSYLKTLYGQHRDWESILSRAKAYATGFFEKELTCLNHDLDGLEKLLDKETVKLVVFARQRKFVTWMRDQVLYESRHNRPIANWLFSRTTFDQAVHDKHKALEAVNPMESTYWLVDSVLQQREDAKLEKEKAEVPGAKK